MDQPKLSETEIGQTVRVRGLVIPDAILLKNLRIQIGLVLEGPILENRQKGKTGRVIGLVDIQLGNNIVYFVKHADGTTMYLGFELELVP